MLDPYDRLQLVNELRPPEGFAFASGIGTTFSLDLESLLTVPLSLVLCEFESREEAMADPMALLEGLRRIAGKLHVFCHRGRIKRPKEGMLLFSFLEDMVVEALPRNRNGSFHPKVWVLRYEREEEVIIRVLVLSRNLTFDKSWDTVLVLEGLLQADRPNAVRQNGRLAQFLRALGGLTTAGGDRVTASLEALAADVSKVEFERPEGFEDFAFWPLGIGTAAPPFLQGEHSRLMVISPFLSDLTVKREAGVLDQLLHRRTTIAQNVLVSRAECLDALAPESIAALLATTRIYVLDDAAAHADQAAAEDKDVSIERPSEALSGLHAKVYVIEDGAKVRVVAGSANATSAAWGRGQEPANVELVVELNGPRRAVGIEPLLGEEGPIASESGGLLRILKPYHPPAAPLDPDRDAERVERLLDESRRLLSDATFSVAISPDGADSYRATLTIPPVALLEDVDCVAWPVMLPSGRAQPVAKASQPSELVFEALTLFALTPFWAFRISARAGEADGTAEFVLRVPVSGMPEGRASSIMTNMIDSPDRFLRYLALLLADDPSAPGGLVGRGAGGGGATRDSASSGSVVLLEDLVRAYSRNPKRLDRIESLLADLRTGTPTPAVIPDGFEELWQAFRAAKA